VPATIVVWSKLVEKKKDGERIGRERMDFREKFNRSAKVQNQLIDKPILC